AQRDHILEDQHDIHCKKSSVKTFIFHGFISFVLSYFSRFFFCILLLFYCFVPFLTVPLLPAEFPLRSPAVRIRIHRFLSYSAFHTAAACSCSAPAHPPSAVPSQCPFGYAFPVLPERRREKFCKPDISRRPVSGGSHR